ncbi:MAG: hypothetical protein GYA55_01395 [SAR324 cluster bacterium]|uniref:Uncharacterized protein n=1 Tax=SAR324 cluster bacterium TaxID=2024889 RepID=A0A7X9FPF2_9DELT|nr:hypothetical protein [SAR324 cluster bacterium]
MSDRVVEIGDPKRGICEDSQTSQTIKKPTDLDIDNILEKYREKLATARRAFSLPADDEHVMQLRQDADPFKQVNFILQELLSPIRTLRNKESSNELKLKAAMELRSILPLSIKQSDILAEHVAEFLGNETRIAQQANARIAHLKECLHNFQSSVVGFVLSSTNEIVPLELSRNAHDLLKLYLHWQGSSLVKQLKV